MKYRTHEICQYDYSDIGEYIDERHTDKPLRNDEIVALLNEFEDLKIQYNNLEMQRNEFHHGARENANQVKQLKKENEELKAFKEKVFEWIDGEIDSVKESCNVLMTSDEAKAVMHTLIELKNELSGKND